METKELLTAAAKRKALDGVKLFVLDMDGTFYLGDRLLPRSLPFIDTVREKGIGFIFFTNNSSKTADQYIEKLAGMGLCIGRDSILTSGDVAAEYLKTHRPGASVYLMGTDRLRKDFSERGIDIFEPCEEEIGSGRTERVPDVVLAAFDTELTFAKLERTCTYIRAGATFIATHPDINCPTDGGFIPDCGAFCAAITLSTGVSPRILGKPYPETIEMIEKLSGFDRSDIAFVGDRLYTDVKTGVANGARGLLVLSGETTLDDFKAAGKAGVPREEVVPTAIFEDLGDIADCL